MNDFALVTPLPVFSGVYHGFKERLKPKIQRVARARYGARGQVILWPLRYALLPAWLLDAFVCIPSVFRHCRH